LFFENVFWLSLVNQPQMNHLDAPVFYKNSTLTFLVILSTIVLIMELSKHWVAIAGALYMRKRIESICYFSETIPSVPLHRSEGEDLAEGPVVPVSMNPRPRRTDTEAESLPLTHR
jgi:hypothetical protein